MASVVTCGRESGEPTVAASAPNNPAGVAKLTADLGLGVPLDAEILAMVAEVDTDRIPATIQTLVGFQTRNTCSDNSGTAPGIGAARDWIQSQFAAPPGGEV